MRLKGPLLALLLLNAGCAETLNIRLDPLPVSAEGDPIPVHAILVLPETVRTAEQAIEFACDGSHKIKLHLGESLELGMRQALSEGFKAVRFDEAPGGLYIEPSLPVFTFEMDCPWPTWTKIWSLPVYPVAILLTLFTDSSIGHVTAQTAFSIKVRDGKGGVLLDQQYRSQPITRQFDRDNLVANRRSSFPADDPKDELRAALQHSLNAVMEEMVTSIVGSVSVRQYAEADKREKMAGTCYGGCAQTPTTTVGKATARVEQSFSSDVDIPPLSHSVVHANRHAILIGIEQYRDKALKADFATRDALIMAQYLTRTLGYDQKKVVLLLNDQAALTDFRRYLEDHLINNVQEGDSILIYYAGLGSSGKRADPYIIPYDGDPVFLQTTGYSLDSLYRILSKTAAKEVLVVLDCGFTGSGGRSTMQQGTRPLGLELNYPKPASDKISVFSASSDNEPTWSYDKEQHGLFTYFLLKGLQREAKVRRTSVPENRGQYLFDYLKENIKVQSQQLYRRSQSPLFLTPNGVDALKRFIETERQ